MGGISALLLGLAYILIIALYVPAGVPPTAAEARLAYLAGNPTVWWAILGLSVLTDLLFVPVALSLYFALKEINRDAMLLASACVALFVVLDLAVTWTNYAALIILSGNYVAATDAAQRAVWVVAATYPAAVLGSSLLFVYNTLTLSLGIFITGLVMLRGVFNKSTAWVGLVTGLLGIVAVAGPFIVSALSVTIIFASMGTTLWVMLAGYRLYQLGQLPNNKLRHAA